MWPSVFCISIPVLPGRPGLCWISTNQKDTSGEEWRLRKNICISMDKTDKEKKRSISPWERRMRPLFSKSCAGILIQSASGSGSHRPGSPAAWAAPEKPGHPAGRNRFFRSRFPERTGSPVLFHPAAFRRGLRALSCCVFRP